MNNERLSLVNTKFKKFRCQGGFPEGTLLFGLNTSGMCH